MLVSDAIGDQIVLAYSRTGLTMVLYVVRRVSFCLPQVVNVRDMMVLMALFTFSLVFLMCSLKFSFGSSVSPRILGCWTVGIVMLLIVKLRVVLYSAGSGVKRVHVDLSGFRSSSFSLVQVNMSFR